MHLHEEIGLIENADGTTRFIDYGNLRNIGLSHPVKCREEAVIWTDRNDFTGFVAMRNQIAQIPMWRPMHKSLLRHPEVVVHLREIFVSGIGDKCDHTFAFRLLSTITQRPGEQRAGR